MPPRPRVPAHPLQHATLSSAAATSDALSTSLHLPWAVYDGGNLFDFVQQLRSARAAHERGQSAAAVRAARVAELATLLRIFLQVRFCVLCGVSHFLTTLRDPNRRPACHEAPRSAADLGFGVCWPGVVRCVCWPGMCSKGCLAATPRTLGPRADC